ncbi:MAG: tRNA pseudouridine(38-40) synthase TruA [Bacteroidota bacterium]|nr:tRNA pseudouridine(38-40) synthase TruA [Bacteroidota bacterium]
MENRIQYRYFIHLAYSGTPFHGWQSQENASSIQVTLSEALSTLLHRPVPITGAGRTDTGVHATQFFAHFDNPEILTLENRKDLVYHLNGYLPPEIAIREILPVMPEAHARFSALSRTYKYFIAREKDPFLKDMAYFYTGPMDLGRMNLGALIIRDTTDFTSFAKLPCDTKTNICHVTEAFWQKKGQMLIFTITADRFLRNMVRAITGTLIDLGRGRIDFDGLKKIIETKDRRSAGYSVPAQGLFLVSVKYPEEIFLKESYDPKDTHTDSKDASGQAESH